MSQINQKVKLIALAHLKNGKKPREVSELLEDISYSMALKLKKDLEEAEANNSLLDLFSLDEATLDTLIENVQAELSEPVQTLTGEIQPLRDSLDSISEKAVSARLLEEQLNKSAITLARQIEARAIVSMSSDSLCELAEALAKLQSAFFAKGTNVQVNNFSDKFSEYLSD